MARKHELRKQAQGRDCEIRIPGVCNGNPETVVLCHVGGAGMGRKADDRHAAIGCSSCHDVVDGRAKTPYNRIERDLILLEAVIRTQQIWIQEGLM